MLRTASASIVPEPFLYFFSHLCDRITSLHFARLDSVIGSAPEKKQNVVKKTTKKQAHSYRHYMFYYMFQYQVLLVL